MHLRPRFTSVDNNIAVITDDGWILTRPPYFHYSTPRPQILQGKGTAKHEARSVLKKRRTFTDNPRLRPPKEQPRPRPSTYVDSAQTQSQRMQNPFPQNASASKHSILLPSLRTDSLWLNRPTQPLRIRKSSQLLQRPPSHGSGISYVVSNSPILPIGGQIPSKPTTPRTLKSAPSPIGKATVGALALTSTLRSTLQTDLETLMTSAESEFNHVRRSSRPISVATSLSCYSQASAAYTLVPEPREFGRSVAATFGDKEDRDASDTFSMRSSETVQFPSSQCPNTNTDRPTPTEDVFYLSVDPRLSTTTSTRTSDTTSTLVDPITPRKDKKRLESTRLSLQPCPSLASANRILSMSDLPLNHDAPSPIDENTYRRYEHEGRVDSPFSDDICADYDYIHAIDVLIYGALPLPDVPTEVVRRPSRSRPTRENSMRRRGSDNRPAPVMKKIVQTAPPVSCNRKPRENSSKVDHKCAVKMDAEKEGKSIFFQVTHFFGKSSSS